MGMVTQPKHERDDFEFLSFGVIENAIKYGFMPSHHDSKRWPRLVQTTKLSVCKVYIVLPSQ